MTRAFEELDTVVYRGIQRERLLPGMRGAIVLVHDPVKRVYEVEFFDEVGKELPTVTVSGDDLELWSPS